MPTTAVFDRNVFGTGFDNFDIVPTVVRVSVHRNMQHIAAGQAVSIVIHVADVMSTPGKQYSFNPASLPEIQIYDPLGGIVVDFTVMDNINVGVYRYTYQTS